MVFGSASAQLPNPILFVTAVPTPNDSSTQTATFSNHLSNMYGAPRGGDLWIRYTDGSLKNLTQVAGFGVMAGLQGTGAIAVREPSVHWSGTKALFSMIVGGATSQGDTTRFFWQIYEITGLGKNETPVITRVPNQPDNFNNLSPIYGTDDRVIFTSDRSRTGEMYLYPAFDEYKGQLTNSGLWSLNPQTGDLLLLDHSPSGDFTPIIDSYGKVLFMRWDRLQRDGNADKDALGKANLGTFNFSDESPDGVPQYGVRGETFPEPQGSRTDLLQGTNMVGMEFNTFFPWQINEDGTGAERLDHIGRHDMNQGVNRAINDDPNVVIFNYSTSGRKNQNPITTFMQVRENPTTPGQYVGIDAFQSSTHAAGQIVTLTAPSTIDPGDATITYITSRVTATPTFEGQTPNASHSGMYRNALPLSNGSIICSHTDNKFVEKNLGTRANPVSRFAFRLKTLTQSGNVWIAGQPLTSGITKTLSYWDPDVQVNYSGELWELDAVEVRARTRPQMLKSSVPGVEQQVFTEEGVDVVKFQKYMKNNNIALATGRDVTHRDKTDKQQPFYLKVAGTQKQTPNSTGKVYDVAYMQMYQGDYRRGRGMTAPGVTPEKGRRVLAVPMHDVLIPPSAGPAGSVDVATDGSWASFVPAHRATTWQLTDPNGTPIVRERYWVNFAAGEIRVCASCHGTNDAAVSPKDPPPTNKPEALRSLLRFWKSRELPGAIAHVSPTNSSTTKDQNPVRLEWTTDPKTITYSVQVSASSNFTQTLLDTTITATTAIYFNAVQPATTYYWRVRGSNDYGESSWTTPWSFSMPAAPLATTALVRPPNQGTGINAESVSLNWRSVEGATSYVVQLSLKQNFTTLVSEKTIPDTTISAVGLGHGTWYYWRVQAKNATGVSGWSSVWSFRTATKVASTQLQTISPPDKTADVKVASVMLSWSPVEDAMGYDVQLAQTSNFANPLINKTGVTDTTLAADGLAKETTYYWHVRAVNPVDVGAWSPTVQFTTEKKEVNGVADGVVDGFTAEIFPQPAQNEFLLHLNLHTDAEISVIFFDATGRIISQTKTGPQPAGSHLLRFDASAFATGVYSCVVRSGATSNFIRFSVVR